MITLGRGLGSAGNTGLKQLHEFSQFPEEF